MTGHDDHQAHLAAHIEGFRWLNAPRVVIVPVGPWWYRAWCRLRRRPPYRAIPVGQIIDEHIAAHERMAGVHPVQRGPQP